MKNALNHMPLWTYSRIGDPRQEVLGQHNAYSYEEAIAWFAQRKSLPPQEWSKIYTVHRGFKK